MADPVNPYLPSGLDRLSTMLMALGAGVSGAESRGQSGWAGLGPAAAMYGAANTQANQQAMQYGMWQQQRAEQKAHQAVQEENIRSQIEERKRKAGMEGQLIGMLPSLLQPQGGGQVEGMRPQQTSGIGPGGDYFSVTGGAESGGDYKAANRMGSGAYGKYQFMPDTWASVAPSLGLPFNIRQATPEQQELAMRELTKRNAQALGTNNPTALYLAHRFGADGAKTVLSSNPTAPIASLFPPTWAQQNPDMRGVTVGQFVQTAQQRFGGASPPNAQGQGDSSGGGAVPPGMQGPQIPNPPSDPTRYAPLLLGDMTRPLAPFLQNRDAARDKYNWDVYNATTKQRNEDRNFDLNTRKNQGDERNQKVGPNGINTPLIDAETEAAKRKAEAEAGVKLNTSAALNLTDKEMERYSKEIRPQVEGAVGSLPNLYEMKRLASGPITAGPLVDARMLGARTADWLGLSDMPEAMVNRTEFNNRAAKNVLAILGTKALGSGSGISATDREFVEKMAGSGGNFSQTELKRIIDIGIKGQQSIIQQHEQTAARLRKLPGVNQLPEDYFKFDAPSYDDWAKANPPLGATAAPAGNPLNEEMRRRGLLGKTPTPMQGGNPLDDEMRRRGLR